MGASQLAWQILHLLRGWRPPPVYGKPIGIFDELIV
jgi:hypothetical protein